MTELQQLMTTLKRKLRSRGITYRAVATSLELSEASVKRLFSSGGITLERLAVLCDLAGMSLAELAQEAAASTPKLSELTPEQETELVSDDKLLLVAVCVLNHLGAADIVGRYRLDEAECLRCLLRLDRMRLIDLLPGNRVRINIARDFDWLPEGPIRHYFRTQGETDFLADRFAQEDEALFFVHGMLTDEARARFQAQLRQLRKNFAALHEESLRAPPAKRHGTGLLLAMREWEAPGFARLRR